MFHCGEQFFALFYSSQTGGRSVHRNWFDWFYPVENAKGSTGLGLSIAKQLKEKMGGSIRAEWENGILSILLQW